MATPQIQEVLNYMRANPPTAKLDAAVHVFAHASGKRDGYMQFIDDLYVLANDKPEPRAIRDSINLDT